MGGWHVHPGYTGRGRAYAWCGLEQDSMEFYHMTQKGMQLKLSCLFLEFLFNIFRSWLTSTSGSETGTEGVLRTKYLPLGSFYLEVGTATKHKQMLTARWLQYCEEN